MASRTVFITGATGFVGRNVLQALQGHVVTALVRSARSRLPEDVEPAIGDVTEPDSLTHIPPGTDVVIHLIGIIEESRGATFDNVIRQGTENMLAAARAANVVHFVLMSALGARDDDRFPYMQAKFRAEEAVKRSGLPHTIVRPSVIFGPGDGFVNALAGVVRSFPVIPVVGDGTTKFQPVSVYDVADAYAAIADQPERIQGETLELGGPDMLTYEEMIDVIATTLGKHKPKIHLPPVLMRLVVNLSSPLPQALRPPVTSEQLKMLRLDNSTSPAALERLIGRPPRPLAGNIDYIKPSRNA